MSPTGTLKVTTPTDREIAMTRVFDAPRNLVFEAYTKPELVKRWLGVHAGWSLAVCEIDLRVGGAYRYVWRGPDGTEMGMGGVYREIVPPERIVATETFDQSWYPGEAVSTLAPGRAGRQDHAHAHGALRVAGGPRRRPQVSHGGGRGRGLRQARGAAGIDAAGSTGRHDTWALGRAQPAARPPAVSTREAKWRAMQKITPFLWFDGKAEEAMNFYVSIFKNSKVVSVTRWTRGRAGRDGHVRDLPARGAGVLRAERRPAVQLHAGHLALRELRDPAGSGRAVGEALRRR